MKDDPIIRAREATGLPPWNDGREPRCPVCGESCDTIYRNAEIKKSVAGSNRPVVAHIRENCLFLCHLGATSNSL